MSLAKAPLDLTLVTNCGCTHSETQTILCDKHWDWLIDFLDEPPAVIPALRQMVLNSQLER